MRAAPAAPADPRSSAVLGAGAAPRRTGAAVPPVALWTAPLAGDLAVTRPFDPPPHAVRPPGTAGVDLGGAPGSPVLAAGDGVVVFAGMVAGRPVVSIDHAGRPADDVRAGRPAVGAGGRASWRRGAPPSARWPPAHAGCPAEALPALGACAGREPTSTRSRSLPAVQPSGVRDCVARCGRRPANVDSRSRGAPSAP